MEEQIKCKNLEKYFFFYGWSGQVEKEINNFDMALMVSKWEGFGLVVCEYMAAQKPIVSVAVGGVKNILNQYNSFMIEDYSCEQFAQKIMKIRYGSKQEIQRMIDHAYQDVKKKYSIEIMVKNLEALISQ